MPQNKNQQEPLSIWDIVERCNNTLAVVTAILSLSGNLQLPPAIQTPEMVLPAVMVMMTLSASEDSETLRKVKDAISELQKFILERINKTKQSQENLPAQKTEILARLEDESAKLRELKKRIEANQDAIEWLEPNTKQEFLISLAKDVGKEALDAHPKLRNPGEAADSHKNVTQFYFDLKNFLLLIHGCLIVCRPNLLDRALAENKLPRSPLPPILYAEAFKIIRDKRINTLSDEAAKELKAYLTYLIKKLEKLPSTT